jgi:hypothetical protein
VPAIIDHIKISRVGLSKDKIKYELNGRLSFASFMWEKPSFSREPITETFDLSLRYIYTKEEGYRDWTTDVVMNVDSLNATLTRKQFIFLQSILDNQLADIRDVSATRTKDNQMQLSETQRILKTQFHMTVRDFKVRLRQKRLGTHHSHKFRVLVQELDS